MCAEELRKMIWRKESWIIDRCGLLHPHQYRFDQRAAEHSEGHDDVHNADLLVIEAGKPFGPKETPLSKSSDQRGRHDRTDDNDRGGQGAYDLADGWIVPSTHERQRGPVEAA